MLWDRCRDQFTLAQWLKGRIYERRSDLSPDGKYMIYFAMNGHWSSETKGSWTAISRAPWLRAIALFSKGDCWHGGGLFTGDRAYWLNDGYGHCLLQDASEVHRDTRYQVLESYGGECPGVYYLRLQRDGWTYLQRDQLAKRKHLDIFEKPLKNGWMLRKIAHAEVGAPPGKGCYWDEHELEHLTAGVLLKFPTWEWADWDRNRLVWAAEGCLYTGYLRSHQLKDMTLIYDFNDLKFEPRCAPY
ncbi:hypothetical protein [Neosynechococcus sphagnicola]|uniref:hypothetical protein n=1 Tax=Neosynechococcus sphagnicola TaxID=1501145 RepID=UPI00195528B5|nr:hypothetical protein [Neosynechococcus sphagnicola]